MKEKQNPSQLVERLHPSPFPFPSHPLSDSPCRRRLDGEQICEGTTMSTSRFLRRAALATAVAGTAAVALSDVKLRWGISGRLSPPPPHDAATRGRGHLGLVRAHPGMRELNEALTSRDTFFLDAAYALAAGVIREPTYTGRNIRRMYKNIAAAESSGDSDAVLLSQYQRIIMDAREGRIDEALEAVVRLIRDHPNEAFLRITAGALCCLHGQSGTGQEWMESVAGSLNKSRLLVFIGAIMFAMPGSSPQSVEERVDGVVMHLAAQITDEMLSIKSKKGECSILKKLEIVVLRTLLRRFVSQQFPGADDYPMAHPSSDHGHPRMNMLFVESSQAILAIVLRARPLCGERLRRMHALVMQALAGAEAEADASAVVDINLLLAFFLIRDGHFSEALQLYKAAQRKNPSDCRPYELAAMLCSITGHTAEQDSWLRDKEKHGVAIAGHTELPALLDELVVAAALGDGTLMTRDPHRHHVVLAAWREVDAWLASARRDRDLTLEERVQLRGLQAFLSVKMQPLLDSANHEPEDSTDH